MQNNSLQSTFNRFRTVLQILVIACLCAPCVVFAQQQRKPAARGPVQQKRLTPAQQRYNEGVAWANKGKLNEAIAAFRQSIQADAKFYEGYMALAIALQQAQQPAEAAGILRQAVNLRPQQADAHYYLGTVLQQLNDADGALAEYRAAVKLNPNAAPLHAAVGFILAAQSKFTEAIP